MINTKICDWLMDNADAPIRYRVAREFLKDEKTAKDIEEELLENPAVTLWLKNLKPQTPPQHWSMEHGSFDFCLENALPKVVQLGLHGGLLQVMDALEFYLAKIRNIDSLDFYSGKRENTSVSYRNRKQWFTILTANFLSLANMDDESTIQYMLGSLDEMHNFVQMKIYDIYLSESERRRLTKVPKNWKSTDYFIKPDVVKEYELSFPYVYDIMGMHRLYDLKNPEVDKKINAVISYISTDEFHHKISDGYGILVEEDGKYHGMGWDPKYPGWFDLPSYMETGNVSRLLFFAQYIIKYPVARKTKWFVDLLNYIEKYRTENGTHLFPATWLKESTGYAVNGHHISFGENRRKKNWREIESTFYVQLLQKDLCN